MCMAAVDAKWAFELEHVSVEFQYNCLGYSLAAPSNSNNELRRS
jgi:hypothetical protein